MSARPNCFDKKISWRYRDAADVFTNQEWQAVDIKPFEVSIGYDPHSSFGSADKIDKFRWNSIGESLLHCAEAQQPLTGPCFARAMLLREAANLTSTPVDIVR